MERKTPDEFGILGSSSLVRRFGAIIASAAGRLPVLDVACGSGRNAFALSLLGCKVICIDKDLTGLEAQRERLRNSPFRRASAQLSLVKMDLMAEPWPFSARSVGGIINVHFLLPALFPCFESSLCLGGRFLLQTVPGCGGNYLELPKAGELRAAFEKAFEFELYKERAVGPPGCGAVTVQAVAKRCDERTTLCANTRVRRSIGQDRTEQKKLTL